MIRVIQQTLPMEDEEDEDLPRLQHDAPEVVRCMAAMLVQVLLLITNEEAGDES